MPEQYFLYFLCGAAFLLGYLTRIALTSPEVHQLRWHLAGYLPRRCPACGAWQQKRKMQAAQHKIVGWTRVCQGCYNEQYHPYSDKKGHSDE